LDLAANRAFLSEHRIIGKPDRKLNKRFPQVFRDHYRGGYMSNIYKHRVFAASLLAALMVLAPVASIAQTRVSLPKNKYSVQDDVKLGSEAARQVEQQFPLLNDQQIQQYVETVGERLVAAIPSQFRQPAFDYRFQVVNASDINAFALPGGPMYVNRGMIQAARNEGEMAGVMAHEISHVALRHATAQQTKVNNPWNQILGAGAILGGAILGGQAGAQAGQIFAAGYFLRYSRDYETQADVLGSQIMANAGYDPRDLANMFQTIAQQGGGRSPEWLSSHPDPGNRFQKINREAALLRVDPNPIKVTREFERAQSRLSSMPPARTMAQIQQEVQSGGGTRPNPTAGGRYNRTVEAPSASYRTYNAGSVVMSVPSNWRDFGSQTSVTFAPEGAYGDQGITHGALVGIYRGNNSGFQNATQAYIDGVLQSNQYLTQRTTVSRTSIAGRQGYTTALSGRSPVTGRGEVVSLFTIPLRSGDLLYIAAVAPEEESYRYENTFRRMISSLRLND
jgi:beta-barrel assembly-enhancing protease